MVRIIHQQQTSKKLPVQAELTMNLIGMYLAQKPEAVKELLSDYGVSMSEPALQNELVSKLIWAIGQNNKRFNYELSKLIIAEATKDNSNSYDHFDFGALFGKKGENDTGGGIQIGADPISAVAGALGSVANLIGAKGKRKEAEKQARMQTLQGMMALKATQEQNKPKSQQWKIVIALIAVIGMVAVAFLIVNGKKNVKQNQLA